MLLPCSVADGQRVVAVQAESVDEVLGANTIAEMMHLDAAMRLDTARRLMATGVTIFRPETTVIDSEVTVGPDTVIEPYVQLLERQRSVPTAAFGHTPVIQNTVLGDDVLYATAALWIRPTLQTAPSWGLTLTFVPESNIGAGAHVGNFVETKKGHAGGWLQGEPSELSRRCGHRIRCQHRRRSHYVQL